MSDHKYEKMFDTNNYYDPDLEYDEGYARPRRTHRYGEYAPPTEPRPVHVNRAV